MFDFDAPLPRYELAALVRAELIERVGAVRLASGRVREAVENAADAAAVLRMLDASLREGCGNANLAKCLVAIADGISKDIWRLFGDGFDGHTLAEHIAVGALETALQTFPDAVPLEYHDEPA
jgi:hypothetical protein